MNKSNKPNKPAPYDAKEREQYWQNYWQTQQTYTYNHHKSRENTYVIDTPPPTISGNLHIGHVFSYTHTDIIARYKRMQGFNVYYPIGWDNNGLPTERRVQNIFKISCDPNATSINNWQPTIATDKKAKFMAVSRDNFLSACIHQTNLDEQQNVKLWQALGFSFDWSLQYTTIDNHSRKLSQLSFLDGIAQQQIYAQNTPVLWDTTYQTAIAQADVEDRSQQGFYYYLNFDTTLNDSFCIATTRPELLAACIAVVAHPEDSRYQHLFGKTAITPLFNIPVPIMPAKHANPEKGTGILMVCTFGDAHDVEFYKQHNLPLRSIIGKNGKLLEIKLDSIDFPSNNPEKAQKYYNELSGLSVKQARKRIIELCTDGNDTAKNILHMPPQAAEQQVKFYEKGELPLEFVCTRQWFLNLLSNKQQLIDQGSKINWHPPAMQKRYNQWVEGLNQNWCISRQRYFGVPFPVWYPLDTQGNINFNEPIFAQETQLPCDPLTDVPQGYTAEMRNKPGGFTADIDVMDTWATSALTPQIASHWTLDNDRHQRLFPADLRPQGHDIIRTWAFYTITKAWLHNSDIPWKNIAISGWVVTESREKMSKSKGNGAEPEQLLIQYSADCLRYWASRSKLGIDAIFDESVFKMGRKLVTKLFNVGKFVMQHVQPYNHHKNISNPLDCAWRDYWHDKISIITNSLNAYDHAEAFLLIEQEFWKFCDYYVELVKVRAYQQQHPTESSSAHATLEYALEIFCKLLAPFLPHICEEIWQWHYFAKHQQSIHLSAWPKSERQMYLNQGISLVDVSITISDAVRSFKTDKQVSLKTPLQYLHISGTTEYINKIKQIQQDIADSAQVELTNIKLICTEKASTIQMSL